MLIFTWGGHWQLLNRSYNSCQLPDFYVTGQARSFFYLKPSGMLHSFGIAFKPHAFRLLFGWDLGEFNERAYCLNELLGKEGALLADQVLSAKTLKERIDIVEDFLLARLQKREMKYENHIILDALNMISEKHGDIHVQQITNSLHISERHLERLFKQHIGLGPKKWANLTRCIHVMRYLSQGKISPLTLTAWLNYFDHSHFYRDFYRFSGEHFGQWNPKAHSLLNSLLEKDFLGNH